MAKLYSSFVTCSSTVLVVRFNAASSGNVFAYSTLNVPPCLSKKEIVLAKSPPMPLLAEPHPTHIRALERYIYAEKNSTYSFAVPLPSIFCSAFWFVRYCSSTLSYAISASTPARSYALSTA